MSLSANLYIGNNDSSEYTNQYLIVKCKTEVSRHHNAYMPDTNPRCDIISLTLVVPSKEDMELYDWYINQTFRSGKIVIELASQYVRDRITTRTFTFENAKCFMIAEMYDISQTSQHLLRMGIMTTKLEIDEVVFE